MASLVEQIYMQAQGGSAGGAGFADFLVQGRQANQRQQQIGIQKQQLAAELATLPLRQTLLRQDAEMNALKIQTGLEERQQQIEDAKQLNVAASDISAALSERDPQGALVSWFDHASINSRLLKNPMFLELRKSVDLAAQATQELMRAEAFRRRADEAVGTPELIQVTNDETGQKETVFRRGPNSFQLLPKPQDKAQELVNRQAVATLQKQIDILNKQRLELDRTDKNYETQRLQLLGEASELQKKINRITGKSTVAPMTQSVAPSAVPVDPVAPAAPAKRLLWTPSGLVPAQ